MKVPTSPSASTTVPSMTPHASWKTVANGIRYGTPAIVCEGVCGVRGGGFS